MANALGYVLAECVGGLKYDLFSFDEKHMVVLESTGTVERLFNNKFTVGEHGGKFEREGGLSRVEIKPEKNR